MRRRTTPSSGAEKATTSGGLSAAGQRSKGLGAGSRGAALELAHAKALAQAVGVAARCGRGQARVGDLDLRAPAVTAAVTRRHALARVLGEALVEGRDVADGLERAVTNVRRGRAIVVRLGRGPRRRQRQQVVAEVLAHFVFGAGQARILLSRGAWRARARLPTRDRPTSSPKPTRNNAAPRNRSATRPNRAIFTARTPFFGRKSITRSRPALHRSSRSDLV